MATTILADGAEAYTTKGGISVTRRRREAPYGEAISSYVDRLDERRGAVFSSKLRISGPLHALGYGHHRSTACDFLLRPLTVDRGL